VPHLLALDPELPWTIIVFTPLILASPHICRPMPPQMAEHRIYNLGFEKASAPSHLIPRQPCPHDTTLRKPPSQAAWYAPPLFATSMPCSFLARALPPLLSKAPRTRWHNPAKNLPHLIRLDAPPRLTRSDSARSHLPIKAGQMLHCHVNRKWYRAGSLTNTPS